MFILGSCRIWNSCYLRNFSDENSTIQCHFADEILQNLDWLINKPVLTDEEQQCFRTKIDNVKWSTLRQNFKSSDTVIVEISSIKLKKLNDLCVNILNGDNLNTITCELSDISDKIIEIFYILKNIHKNVVFFCHANIYSKRNMGFIKNRSLLQESFKKALKTTQFNFIDPSSFVNYYGQSRCMAKTKSKDNIYDINHYSQFMIELVAKEIEIISGKLLL